MPGWLRFSLVGLLVVLVFLIGVPLLMGGSAMVCEPCPDMGVMTAAAACVGVLMATVGVLVLGSPSVVTGHRRSPARVLLRSRRLERPPRSI